MKGFVKLKEFFNFREIGNGYIEVVVGGGNVYDMIEFMGYMMGRGLGDERLINFTRCMKAIYEISVLYGNGLFSTRDREGMRYLMELLGVKRVYLLMILRVLEDYGFLERVRRGLYRVSDILMKGKFRLVMNFEKVDISKVEN
jgi:hypothetical protein